MNGVPPPRLIITADDYGYSPRYDAGILEAARAGAIDAVSVMVLRAPSDPAALLESGVEVGLHLEPQTAVRDQAELFEQLFGRPPDHIDGHHHCHAAAELRDEVAKLAGELGIRVRSVDEALGRTEPSQPALPKQIEAVRAGVEPPPGLTEWFVHPGHADPAAGSSFDAAREEDLELLLALAEDPQLQAWRDTVPR